MRAFIAAQLHPQQLPFRVPHWPTVESTYLPTFWNPIYAAVRYSQRQSYWSASRPSDVTTYCTTCGFPDFPPVLLSVILSNCSTLDYSIKHSNGQAFLVSDCLTLQLADDRAIAAPDVPPYFSSFCAAVRSPFFSTELRPNVESNIVVTYHIAYHSAYYEPNDESYLSTIVRTHLNTILSAFGSSLCVAILLPLLGTHNSRTHCYTFN